MKKNKIILSIIAILTLILSNNVKAYNATGYLGTKHDSKGIYFPSNSEAYYSDRDFAIEYGGNRYTAYCLDPGYNFNSGSVPMNCEPIDGSNEKAGGMVWLINNLSGNHLVDMLAIRMAAVYFDFHQTSKKAGLEIAYFMTKMDEAIAQEMAQQQFQWEADQAEANGANAEAEMFYQAAQNAERFAQQYREEAYRHMDATTSDGRAAIEEAYKLARQAIEHMNDSVDYNIANQMSATITKASSSPHNDYYEAILTVTVSSTSGNIKAEEVKFECENCQVAGTQIVNASGTTVTINVGIHVPSPNCSYKLKVKYEGLVSSNKNIAYVCYNNDPQLQHLLAVMPDSLADQTPGGAIGEFEETITSSNGGNYFTNYCANQDDLICTQKTTLTKPSFCDDDSDQTMNITAPTDIKACILKEEDEAGNTYEMNGFESNKYCSVYCKEDYEMTMPGAQYANSGRYFQTRNVLVKGTKTCYTTSSKSIQKDDTTNIDINGFITDIIEAQKNLLDAYNNYKKYEAIVNFINANTATKSTTGCPGDVRIYKYAKGTVQYEKYSTDKKQDFDQNTGKYIGHLGSESYSVDEKWGDYYSGSHNECDGETRVDMYGNPHCSGETKCVSDGGTYSKSEDFEAQKNYYATLIDRYSKNISALVKEFSSCYNWDTNYCFDPEVSFDYQEQYSSNINYQQISKNVTDNQDIKGSTSLTIDNYYNKTDTGAPSENVDYISGSTSSINLSGNPAHNISTLVSHIYHLRKTATGEAEYNNRQEFQANYPHGTVDTVSDKSSLRTNYSYLGAIFPIAMKTSYGVYNWALKFEDIGQYMNQASCSRMGRLNDVVKKLDNSLNTDIGYVCVYVVDCPDCDYSCACPENMANGYTCVEKTGINGKYCVIEPPCEDDCDYSCVGEGCNFCTEGEYPCILTPDEKYVYRSVSLNDLFPNNRTIGVNWSNTKGALAKSNIEKSGESSYINASYSFKLTAENMRNIRIRNQQLQSYVDGDGLQYYSQNGIQNFYGKSKFLDEGDKLGYFTTLKRSSVWNIYPGGISNGVGPAWN